MTNFLHFFFFLHKTIKKCIQIFLFFMVICLLVKLHNQLVLRFGLQGWGRKRIHSIVEVGKLALDVKKAKLGLPVGERKQNHSLMERGKPLIMSPMKASHYSFASAPRKRVSLVPHRIQICMSIMRPPRTLVALNLRVAECTKKQHEVLAKCPSPSPPPRATGGLLDQSV